MEDQQKPQSMNSKPAERERRGGGRGRPGRRPPSEPREFDQKILDLARVTRVTAGGKRMSFRCALVVGDKKGRVGMGVAKGADVQIALDKAVRLAKKNVIRVPIVNGTIPHAIEVKFGSAHLILKPAPKGTGLKCGGAVRVVLELAGLPNAVSKIVNSSNKINIAKATFAAIEILRRAPLPAAEAKPAAPPQEK
jgi:small subunit ribosomal protein S5